MKTEWDYSQLADAYLQRPDYSVTAVEAMLALAGGNKQSVVCDVGAGVAHLTLLLSERVQHVDAVEPNDAMRRNGISRTAARKNVTWFEGTGEKTGRSEGAYDLVTFGSSFNVCDRAVALLETARILRPGGWFACMWNHRRLDDPIQEQIETIIRERVTSYRYGARREDQTEVIKSSGLFGEPVRIAADVVHEQTIVDCVEAWRSHATLERQAGERFLEVVKEIEGFLTALGTPTIQVPYSTNIWLARLN
jgi:ubiquinone/menaquinone biosynthesis C-methylase UbiE